MHWNIANAFDTIEEPKKNDTVLSTEEYNDKMSLTAGIIKKYQTDIVTLCEVENMNVLSDLAKRCGYEYFYLIEGNDPRGIDVAIMSIYEMNYKSNKDMPTPYPGNPRYKFSRDCVTGQFTTAKGKNFCIVTTHLKSSFRDDGKSEMKRDAQVKGILNVIDNIYTAEKTEPYLIVTGDLNATRYSSPLQILEKAGLKILNYREKQDEFYTYIYRKEKQDLDYIIVNQKLEKAMKHPKLQAIHDKMVSDVSDHYPIILKFDL
ncbi:MAG: hypothetical protein II220_07670 [Spirochaetales bacterium]|nr:hypothetical protein [Spirochaetales bacterium]